MKGLALGSCQGSMRSRWSARGRGGTGGRLLASSTLVLIAPAAPRLGAAQLPVTRLVHIRVRVRCAFCSKGVMVNRLARISGVGKRLGSALTASSISGYEAGTALG